MKLHMTIKGKWVYNSATVSVLKIGPFVAHLEIPSYGGTYRYKLSNNHGILFAYAGTGWAKNLDEAKARVEKAIKTIHYTGTL